MERGWALEGRYKLAIYLEKEEDGQVMMKQDMDVQA